MVANEFDLIGHEDGTNDPDEETDDAKESDKKHPEPEEEVDLLVVEVDRENALDRILLRIAEVLAANLEVAERDPREGYVAVLRPVGLGDDVAYYIVAERVVLRAEDVVEHEQLADDVRDVADLREEEQDQQVDARPAVEMSTKQRWTESASE